MIKGLKLKWLLIIFLVGVCSVATYVAIDSARQMGLRAQSQILAQVEELLKPSACTNKDTVIFNGDKLIIQCTSATASEVHIRELVTGWLKSRQDHRTKVDIRLTIQ
jgi:hypothetical protein